jgi:signal recognition particle receptor subunit beta
MGSFVSYLVSFVYERQKEILVFGATNSGRTTIMRHLLHGSMVETTPAQIRDHTKITGLEYCSLRMSTFYFSHYNVNYANYKTDYWENRMARVDGLMFVIDSALESESLADVLVFFANMTPRHKPLLVFFNKMDATTKSLQELLVEYRLDEYHTLKDNLLCQPCTALPPGKGVYEGLEWLFAKVATDVQK